MTRTSILVGVLLASLPATGQAHGGLFRGPERPKTVTPPTQGSGTGGSRGAASTASRATVTIDPMGSPEVPLSDDRWEFWWEFNHDRFVGLRAQMRSQAGAGGPAFVAVSDDEKMQILLPALLRGLRDKDDQVRSAAAFGLARLGGDEVQGYLRHTMLDDSSLAVRTNAVLAMGQAGSSRAVEPLRELLWRSEASDEMRCFAAVSLGVLATADASEALREALAQEEARLNTTLRIACTYALGLTEDPANAPFLRSLAVHGHSDARLHSLQILALGRVGDRAANAILMKALESNETQVRRSAAIALGAVARPADLDVVAALRRVATSDPDRLTRNLSDISLGEIASNGGPEIVEDLRARLAEATAQSRPYLCLALGISRRSAALDDLLEVFRTEKSHSVRAACAVSLGLLGRGEAVPLLRAAFRTTADPHLQAYLSLALGQLGDQEVRDELTQHLTDSTSPAVVRWSAVGLALLGSPTLGEDLRAAYQSAPSQLMRGALVHVIGLTGDRSAMQFVLESAQVERTSIDLVRALATLSVGMICDRGREPVAAVYSRRQNYTLDLPYLDELLFLF